MYRKISHDVEIIVVPKFINRAIDLNNESIISWEYEVFINNASDYFLEISVEHLTIIDEFGKELSFSVKHSTKNSHLIKPKRNIMLKSYIPTLSESAIVKGYFTAYDELGRQLILEIPTFSLDSPEYTKSTIN